MRTDYRFAAQLVGWVLAVIVLVIGGRLWFREWVVHQSCALTGCGPASMTLIGWSTQATLPAFGLIAISGRRRTRTGRRLLWTTAVLVLVPGLIFMPAKGENLFQVASAGDGGYGAFGVGLVAAWLAMFSVLFVAMPVALGIEELAYRRSRPSPRGSTSIRVATHIIVGYAIAASLAALAIAQLVVTG